MFVLCVFDIAVCCCNGRIYLIFTTTALCGSVCYLAQEYTVG